MSAFTLVLCLIHGSVVSSTASASPREAEAAAQATPFDMDGDGMLNADEVAFGLDPGSAAGDDGAEGDPDEDGVTNLAELSAHTHPRGFVQRYFAEGSASTFFRTRLALANGSDGVARVLVTFLGPKGERVPVPITVPARAHRELLAENVPNLPGDFAIHVESDLIVAVERTMTWDARGYGSHSEAGIAAPARRWYLAEGATGDPFKLYYLIANPGGAPANVTITYLRQSPAPPIVKTYPVGPHSRLTVWVDTEDPALEATDVGAIIESDVDVVVERAMYRDTDEALGAGHAAAAVPAPATSWFLAEGSTGPFFDLFLLIANPQSQAAELQVTYLRPIGEPLVKTYTADPKSRLTIPVDGVDPLLANTPVSIQVRSTNGQAVVVERAMWWPDGLWYEAHASAGSLSTGTRWLVADAELGGATDADTYVLVANTGSCPAKVDVSLLFDTGAPLTRRFDVPPTSRFNVDMRSLFPEAIGRRFGVLVASAGPCPAELVVERSTYTSADGIPWSGGANAPAQNVSPLLAAQGTLVLKSNGVPHVIETRRADYKNLPVTMTALSWDPFVATVTLDPETGRVTVLAGSDASSGSATVTLTATTPGMPPEVQTFEVRISTASPTATFSTPHLVGPRLLFPAVADLNKDGWPEILGTMNDGAGVLTPYDIETRGFTQPNPAIHRDNRLADLNGDGWLDIITGYYTGVNEPYVTRMFFNNGDNTFQEDPDFAAMGLKGFVHTIIAADLDNDTDLDLFIPVYTQNDPREQFFLLINDGHGKFTEIADAAGVASRNWPYGLKTEGSQAVDFDGDGWIDLYTASRFFFNNGNLTFTDRAAELGLPQRYDEGLKFTDWNNDGRLDLIKHDEWIGPYLYEFNGVTFTERQVMPWMSLFQAYGMNIADVNNDGFEDIITSGGKDPFTAVLINKGDRFEHNPVSTITGWTNDSLAFGDFNRDGRMDVAKRDLELTYVLNETPATAHTLVVEVVGDQGQQNQQGRVIRVTPISRPEVTYTRVVDGGSGYITQNEYPVTVATELSGPYRVVVGFDRGPVEFVMQAGERKRVFRSGVIQNLP